MAAIVEQEYTLMPKMPKFTTEEELAEWIDTHDTAPFIDEMENADETFEVKRTPFKTRPLDVRLRSDLYEALEAAAERKGVPYQILVQTWLREKLLQEAPDLVQNH
jgi:predicted DNA binding CopG/RHH family protein